MSAINRKIQDWYERQDEYEKTAIVAFGIGMPLVITIFVITLLFFKMAGKLS